MHQLGIFNGTSTHQDLSYSPQVNQSYNQVNLHQEDSSVIDCSVPGNRLVEHIDGSIRFIPKTPAELAGEYLLRPAIDLTWHSLKSVGHILYRMAVSIDSVMKPLFNFGAEAVTVDNEKEEEEWKDSSEAMASEERVMREFSSASMKTREFSSLLYNIEGEEKRAMQVTHSEAILADDVLIDIQRVFDKTRKIIKDLSNLVRNREKNYQKWQVTRELSCKRYHNARWTLDYILTNLKRGEESIYSPYTSKSVVMNSTFSLSLNGHPLSSERQESSHHCRSIETIQRSLRELQRLSVEFISIERFSKQLLKISPNEDTSKLSEDFNNLYRVIEIVHKTETRKLLNNLRRTRTTVYPSMLTGSKTNKVNLIVFAEEVQEYLKSGFSNVDMALSDLFKKEEKSQARQLFLLVARVQKKQQEIVGEGSYFTSMTYIVERTVNHLPVSWKFVQKGFFGELHQLFSFTYECHGECDENISSQDRIVH